MRFAAILALSLLAAVSFAQSNWRTFVAPDNKTIVVWFKDERGAEKRVILVDNGAWTIPNPSPVTQEAWQAWLEERRIASTNDLGKIVLTSVSPGEERLGYAGTLFIVAPEEGSRAQATLQGPEGKKSITGLIKAGQTWQPNGPDEVSRAIGAAFGAPDEEALQLFLGRGSPSTLWTELVRKVSRSKEPRFNISRTAPFTVLVISPGSPSDLPPQEKTVPSGEEIDWVRTLAWAAVPAVAMGGYWAMRSRSRRHRARLLAIRVALLMLPRTTARDATHVTILSGGSDTATAAGEPDTPNSGFEADNPLDERGAEETSGIGSDNSASQMAAAPSTSPVDYGELLRRAREQHGATNLTEVQYLECLIQNTDTQTIEINKRNEQIKERNKQILMLGEAITALNETVEAFQITAKAAGDDRDSALEGKEAAEKERDTVAKELNDLQKQLRDMRGGVKRPGKSADNFDDANPAWIEDLLNENARAYKALSEIYALMSANPNLRNFADSRSHDLEEDVRQLLQLEQGAQDREVQYRKVFEAVQNACDALMSRRPRDYAATALAYLLTFSATTLLTTAREPNPQIEGAMLHNLRHLSSQAALAVGGDQSLRFLSELAAKLDTNPAAATTPSTQAHRLSGSFIEALQMINGTFQLDFSPFYVGMGTDGKIQRIVV